MKKKTDEEERFIDENEEVLEDSEYSVKGDFSKAELIQKHLVRCMELRSKDMRPGYTTYVMGKPEVIPDSRKEYVGCIEALKNTLIPELESKMPEVSGIWDEGKEELFKKYAYHERTKKVWKDGKAVWEYSGRVFIPQKGSMIVCNNDKPESVGITYSSTAWDHLINAYWDDMVEIADELYAELNKLIHKLDYFKGKVAW